MGQYPEKALAVLRQAALRMEAWCRQDSARGKPASPGAPGWGGGLPGGPSGAGAAAQSLGPAQRCHLRRALPRGGADGSVAPPRPQAPPVMPARAQHSLALRKAWRCPLVSAPGAHPCTLTKTMSADSDCLVTLCVFTVPPCCCGHHALTCVCTLAALVVGSAWEQRASYEWMPSLCTRGEGTWRLCSRARAPTAPSSPSHPRRSDEGVAPSSPAPIPAVSWKRKDD